MRMGYYNGFHNPKKRKILDWRKGRQLSLNKKWGGEN
jgi:hypothetical protein